ncbi:MAG: glycoside hydrolase family 5 protein, partial [Chlorobi bacterium]|nr:glycoside hydrolase family 5 protein [Chlorobiota bacterium]
MKRQRTNMISYKLLRYVFLMVIVSTGSVSWGQSLTKFEKWQQPGFFKGFNISEWNNVLDQGVVQAEFDSLKTMGANLAIIQTQGFRDEFTFGKHIYDIDEGDTTYWQDVLDTMVTYARNAGGTGIPYVICVRTGPGRTDVAEDKGSSIWTNPEHQRRYAQMLREMAQRYLPDSLFVGFDLIQEPNPFGDVLFGVPVRELDSAMKAQGMDVNALYTRCIDSVRKVAPDLPLMVQGVHWSNPSYFSLVKKQPDDKIIYNVHCYNPADFSHQDSAFILGYPGSFWSNELQDFATFNKAFLRDVVYKPVRDFRRSAGGNVPVIIGELGISHPQNGSEQYLDDIMTIAEEEGWHFAIWNFNNGVQFYYQSMDQVYRTGFMDLFTRHFSGITSVDEKGTAAGDVHLARNFPNPFSSSTTIIYRGSHPGRIEVR